MYVNNDWCFGMNSNPYLWLKNNWPVSTPFLAVYFITMLLLFRDKMDLALLLLWLHVPVYFLHQFEEYIYPGGFLEYFNKNVLGSDLPEFPMTKTAVLWINVPVIFVAYPVSVILAGQFGVSVGLWIVYFSIINASSHVGMYLTKGYNPGFVVSVLLNIPVGVLTIGYFISQDLASLKVHIIGFLLALGVQVGLMVYGFLILKPKIKSTR